MGTEAPTRIAVCSGSDSNSVRYECMVNELWLKRDTLCCMLPATVPPQVGVLVEGKEQIPYHQKGSGSNLGSATHQVCGLVK